MPLIAPNSHHSHLFDYVRSLPSLGIRELTVRVKGSSPRKAMLKVASGSITLLPSVTEPELRHRPP
ncbi:MAG: hypothetical protein IIB60_06540 [Planctomycetes bacterium]|nr:hypothetical protein [Planctomycetota bacterium]